MGGECTAWSGEQRQLQPIGAAFVARWLIQAQQASSSGLWGAAIWEAFHDTNYGMIATDGTIAPYGYLLSKAGATLVGTEMSASGQGTVLAVQTGSGIGVMVVNTDPANSIAGPVALSSCPLGGNLTVVAWVMGAANPSGAESPLNVRGGITDSLTIPPAGVAILHS